MASKKAVKQAAKQRPIRFDQFKKQLEEVGVENLQEIELSQTESIWIRLGNSIDSDDAEEFQDRLDRARDSSEVSMIILDYYDGATAEDQWKLYESYGGTADQLAVIFTSATRDQADRLGKLRLRR